MTIAAAVPDADVIAFRYGVAYNDVIGHRGFTHSLLFAALFASVVSLGASRLGASRTTTWIAIALSTASHGVLDAATNGGAGVAFFSPFSNERFFFPWRPIEVSPIGVARFVSARGLAVLQSELIWVWLPVLAIATAALVLRRRVAPRGFAKLGVDSARRS